VAWSEIIVPAHAAVKNQSGQQLNLTDAAIYVGRVASPRAHARYPGKYK
jgi:hypothetical protein